MVWKLCGIICYILIMQYGVETWWNNLLTFLIMYYGLDTLWNNLGVRV